MRAAALVLLAAACSDTVVDLGGVYRVDSVVASEPCGDDQPVDDPPAFLQFTRDEFLGTPFYTYVECVDEAATLCASPGGLLEGYFEPRDHGWVGFSSYASGTDSDCALRVDENTATLRGVDLVLEDFVHRDDHAVVAAGQCTPLEAEARNRAMPCTAHSELRGTLLRR